MTSNQHSTVGLNVSVSFIVSKI